ncbi:MAG TPA: hypothetical protein VIQ05_26635 [Tardiphaga sp.]
MIVTGGASCAAGRELGSGRYPVQRLTATGSGFVPVYVVFAPRRADFACFARPAGGNHAIVTTSGDLPISEFLIIGGHHGSLKRIS